MEPKTSPPRLLWAGIAAALLLTAGLLAALWPALRALSGAFEAAIEDNAWLVGLALLTALGALLAAGVRAALAWSWKKSGHAQQAHIVTLPGGLPAHVADVRETIASEIHFALDRHYAALLAEAERPTPLLTSQNQHIHIEQTGTPPQSAEIAAPPQLPQLDTAQGTLAQLRSIGHICRSGNSLLVGYAGGQPQYIELPECGFIGIGGQPRSGKSTAALLLIEQAIVSGWHVFIADPHIHKADGLLNRCLPFSGRLAKQAVTPDEIASMIRLVDKIGRRRVQGDADRTPVILVIDEFTNLVWREALPDDVLRILPSMAIEYAGVGVHGMIISHDYSRAGLGSELGAALRRSFTHRIAKRMDAGNVEFLFPKGSTAQARAVSGLETAQGLYHGPDGAITVAVPLLTDDDAAYAAQGAPRRPYAPRPQIASSPPPPASQIPPTTRVPLRQAPPTVPMAPPTVQEEIVLLLRNQGAYLTASEIAAKLGADLQVARTEVSALARAGQLDSRKCSGRTTKERLEYTIAQSTNQRINPSTALSA